MGLNSNYLIEIGALIRSFPNRNGKLAVQMSSPHTQSNPVEPVSSCPEGEFVCHCHQVTETVIRTSIDEIEARSVEEIMLRTKAGSGCRGCHCKLQRMLDGLSPNCGRFAFCGQCGCIEALCACNAA